MGGRGGEKGGRHFLAFCRLPFPLSILFAFHLSFSPFLPPLSLAFPVRIVEDTENYGRPRLMGIRGGRETCL